MMDKAVDRTSEFLLQDNPYTRDDLRELFGINDATLNTGVFRPKDTSSIWLFITEEKTADRTQYMDRLEGDTLHWQGQMSGRTDHLIIEHQARGLELLVFLRKRKYEFPGAAFRYLGPFSYASHSGARPTSFILQRQLHSDPIISPDEADDEAFDPSSIEDARQRVLRSVAQRRGQRAFREALLLAYAGRCAMSGCSVRDVLDAAHIHPYRGPDTNKVTNGLLLRTDVHMLFDCGLIAVDAYKMTIIVAQQLRASEYGAFHGRKLSMPQSLAQHPSRDALKKHRETTIV